MTYLRPIEPNREDRTDFAEDEQRDSGPKRRRRRSAWRDGSVDQTVIEGLESTSALRAFERTIVASFDPRTAIERELIHRLVALLWRLRRASAIEAGLLQLGDTVSADKPPTGPFRTGRQMIGIDPDRSGRGTAQIGVISPRRPRFKRSRVNTLALRFLDLAQPDATVLERASTHEARLWRQAAQTIWMLDALRQPPPAAAPVVPQAGTAQHLGTRLILTAGSVERDLLSQPLACRE